MSTANKTKTLWYRQLIARDPAEPHRAATPLELLFDLCFVIAIAQVATQLHHSLSARHVLEAIPAYGMIFFAIWWAWMNFTWFASAYDNDDVFYRLKVLVQIAGALVIAAGVKPAFEDGNFAVVTSGYAIIRISQIALWLRAAKDDPPRRRTCLHYALGLAVVQAGWIAALALDGGRWPFAAAILVVAELSVPVWAERVAPTTWHRHHIAERYGLLTIIVLGESLLSATLAVQSAHSADALSLELVMFIVGALLVFFAMWWIYFDVSAGDALRGMREAFLWGYGHLIIFASTAAVGAGIAFLAEDFGADSHGRHAAGEMTTASAASGLAVGVPVALFIISVSLIHLRPHRCDLRWLQTNLALVALVLAVSFTPWPLFAIGVVLACYVTTLIWHAAHRNLYP